MNVIPISIILSIASGYLFYSCFYNPKENKFPSLTDKETVAVSAFIGLVFLVVLYLYSFYAEPSLFNCHSVQPNDCVEENSQFIFT